jgi:bifunctional DNA-binding transcriptional regulator/antitoxin component of YhaV-PrlF toxin-antitoxin module
MKGQTLEPQFVRTYSRGQVTIPQNYRDYLGITDGSWLKIFLKENGLFIQPLKEEKMGAEKKTFIVKPTVPFTDYLRRVKKAKGAFGQSLVMENKKIRKEIVKSLGEVNF